MFYLWKMPSFVCGFGNPAAETMKGIDRIKHILNWLKNDIALTKNGLSL